MSQPIHPTSEQRTALIDRLAERGDVPREQLARWIDDLASTDADTRDEAVRHLLEADPGEISARFHLANRTGQALKLKSKSVWVDFFAATTGWKDAPPEQIAGYGQGGWCGYCTGRLFFDLHVEAIYQRSDDDEQTVTMNIKMPLLGDNVTEGSTSIPGTSLTHEGGDGQGDRAVIWFQLDEVTP